MEKHKQIKYIFLHKFKKMSSPSFSQGICWGAKKIQQKQKIMLCAMQNYRSKELLFMHLTMFPSAL